LLFEAPTKLVEPRSWFRESTSKIMEPASKLGEPPTLVRAGSSSDAYSCSGNAARTNVVFPD
jgi:hypothetical protein